MPSLAQVDPVLRAEWQRRSKEAVRRRLALREEVLAGKVDLRAMIDKALSGDQFYQRFRLSWYTYWITKSRSEGQMMLVAAGLKPTARLAVLAWRPDRLAALERLIELRRKHRRPWAGWPLLPPPNA